MARPAKTPGTSVTAAKNTLPASINEEMAKEVAALSSRLSAPSGDRIVPTKAGTFKMPDGSELEKLDAVIVDFVSSNTYYDKPYVKGHQDAPTCFAIGLEPTTMVPSKNAPDPQAETCSACWANQFGSNGKGKACTNNKLLAVLPPDADAETAIQVAKVPTTSIKRFDAYVGSVARAFQRPVRAVITEITNDASVGWENMQFGNPTPCSQEQLLMGHSRRNEAMQRLMVEPDLSAFAAKAPPAQIKKPAARGRPARG